MECDRCMELLALRPDGELSDEEERELEEHLAACPDCRAAGAQLAALRDAFPELEDISAPEGFAQGVMDRIRREEPKKVIPLFKRLQVRALAGLAACLVVVAGLYGASQQKKQADWDIMVRSFTRDVVEDFADVSACESLSGEEESPQVNASLVDPELADAPQIAAYAAPGPTQADASCGTVGAAPEASIDGVTAQKTVPNPAAEGLDRDSAYAEAVLTLDRMPEGGWELIPPETPASPNGLTVSVELMEQLERLAQEQGINASRTPGPEASDHCLIVILDETE